MTRWEPEAADDDEEAAEDAGGVTRFGAIVAALLLLVLAVLIAIGVAVAAAAAAGAASLIARWTGSSAGHVLAGLLVFSSLLVVIWQTGKLVEEIRWVRRDVWRILEQRDSELEALQELVERATDDHAVQLRGARAETSTRQRRHRERKQ